MKTKSRKRRPEPKRPEVWIVDDDELFCRSLEYFLEEYPTRSFQDLASVQKALNQELPEIVLLDLMFGRQLHVGVELLGILRSDHPSVLVVIVSASRDMQDAYRTGALGAFDFIMKGDKDQNFYAELREKVKTASRHSTVNHVLSSILGTSDLVGRLTGRPIEHVHPVVDQVLRAFFAHMSQCGPSLSGLSRVTGISKSTIHDRFRSTFRAPPARTLTEIALIVAGCMHMRGFSVREIAEMIGMSTERLRQRFQADYGCPPSRAHEIPLFAEILSA